MRVSFLRIQKFYKISDYKTIKVITSENVKLKELF